MGVVSFPQDRRGANGAGRSAMYPSVPVVHPLGNDAIARDLNLVHQAAAYNDLLKRRPFVTNSLSAGLLGAIGDVGAQLVLSDGDGGLDGARTARFTVFRICWWGPFYSVGHTSIACRPRLGAPARQIPWSQLPSCQSDSHGPNQPPVRFPPLQAFHRVIQGWLGPGNVLGKLALDQLVWTPPSLAMFFTTMTVMEGGTWREGWHRTFGEVGPREKGGSVRFTAHSAARVEQRTHPAGGEGGGGGVSGGRQGRDGALLTARKRGTPRGCDCELTCPRSDRIQYSLHRRTRAQPMRSPQLPSGYATCILLAFVPPLWRAVMHPRLMAFRATQKGQVWRHGPQPHVKAA